MSSVEKALVSSFSREQPISVEEASSSTASKQSSSSPVIQVPGQCQVAVYIAFPESYLGQLPNLALGTSRVDYFDAGSANMPSESEAG
jgi:hypothetical protein